MSEVWTNAQWLITFGGAALLLLLDLALCVALAAVSMLSPVALRRVSAGAERRRGFLESMQRPPSRHRTAAILLQRLCLLGAAMLLVLAARAAGWSLPLAGGFLLGAIGGALLIESLLAPVIAVWDPRRAACGTAFLVRGAYALLYPIVEPTHALLSRIGRNRHRSDEEREEEQEEEVEALIEVGERSGLLEAKEGQMMRGIVDLDETPVREIMTPRTDIVALAESTSVADARLTLLKAGHSRLPVFRGSIDHVIGVLHSRDLFRAWDERKEDQPISRYLRSATFVPESLSAAELLSEMRQKTHLSMVVDEYGGIAGLVTLEDLLEEIVGDIRDEHETDEEPVRAQPDGSYIISAGTHVKELESLFGVEFEEREFDTVGGMVVFGFGRVPSAGEILELRGLRVEVLQADRRRVRRVRVATLDASGPVRATP